MSVCGPDYMWREALILQGLGNSEWKLEVEPVYGRR